MEEEKHEHRTENYSILVWIGFLCMALSAVLQYMKTSNTRSIESICVPSLIMIMIAHILMVIYACNNNLTSMIGTYSISITFLALYIYMIYTIKSKMGRPLLS